MKKIDYYAILGVSRTATQDQIRDAFRKIARQHHPDIAKDKKASEQVFKDANEANETLSDLDKRRVYDDEQNLALITDLSGVVKQVVEEYFDEFAR